MRELSLREMQLAELHLLQIFDKICKKHNLNYSLYGGTLLGAVRHKGFIPWDDDIDVCMPREDYEKFLDLDMSQEVPAYVRRTSKKERNYITPFAKLVDTRYQVENKYEDPSVKLYLWIDIFPVDGLPDTEFGISMLFFVETVLLRIGVLCRAKLGEGRTEFRRRAKKYLRPLARVLGPERCTKIIEYACQRCPFKDAEYVWGVNGSTRRYKGKMKKDEFLKTEPAVFEGQKFPIMVGWDYFLTIVYGNYWELPCKKNRKRHILKTIYRGDEQI